MRMHVVYDHSGKIIAAARIRDGVMGPEPVAKPGHHKAILEVPHEHAHLSFHDVCHHLVVETAAVKPHLKSK